MSRREADTREPAPPQPTPSEMWRLAIELAKKEIEQRQDREDAVNYWEG
jgi:hypothetical protein